MCPVATGPDRSDAGHPSPIQWAMENTPGFQDHPVLLYLKMGGESETRVSHLENEPELKSTTTIMKRTQSFHVIHPGGHDQLQLNYSNDPYNCHGCREQGIGQRYICKKHEHCNFKLHECCNRRSGTTTSHDFFKNSTFKLYFQLPKSTKHKTCSACGKDVLGYVYYCEAGGWYLHPYCCNLKNEIPVGDMKYRLQKKVPSKCICCNHREVRDVNPKIPGWSYVSKDKKYNFHVHCLPEMLLKAWKKAGDNGSDSLVTLEKKAGANLVALENLELPLHLKKKGKKGRKLWKIAIAFLQSFACFLFGDPITLFASSVNLFIQVLQ